MKLDRPASAIAVQVRGTACGGVPSLRLVVDGAKSVVRSVSDDSYTTLTIPRALAAGRHRIGVALASVSKSKHCRRAVMVDTIKVKVEASAPTLAQTAAVDVGLQDVLDDPITAVALPPTPTPILQPPTTVPPTTATPPTTTAPSTTTPPSTEPPTTTPPPPVETGPRLRWAPPALTAPTTLVVPQGDKSYTLDTTKDYIVDLGAVTHNGTVRITGGHNVVMIGGRIALPQLSAIPLGLGIKNSTGTVHVEGIEFDGTSGREMDAIQIMAPDAIVQVENVRANGLLGTYDTNHSDVIQPWGGVRALRVDRLTADSNYQGIFTRPDQGAIGSVDLRHVDLTFNNSQATSSGGYLLWMTTGCDMAPTTMSDVFIQPRTGKSVGAAVWPPTSDPTCPAKLTGTQVTWPSLPVNGAVTGGAPAAGAFVPTGVAGPGYVSPGYE